MTIPFEETREKWFKDPEFLKEYEALESEFRLERALELDPWQLEQIDKGIEAAHRGEFVSESQMRAFFKQWGVDEA